MAQQLRKFEQEAIASEIKDKIKSNLKTQGEDLALSSDYLGINASIREMNKLRDKKSEIENQISELRKVINGNVEDFNTSFCNKDAFYLQYNDHYSGVHNIDFSYNEWQITTEVQKKLAIALLSPDWKDTLPQIIEDIANHFTR